MRKAFREIARQRDATAPAPLACLSGPQARSIAQYPPARQGTANRIAFAQRANAPAWFSTGLMDRVCPPSTAFAAFHAYAGRREIRAWEYNGHEAGGSLDLEIALDAFSPALF